ncbi:MAG: pyrroloquinoline quinone biosynthesis protein PqqB [Ahrensia sp.]|nr:pyrroloquinoline quinone biosynthesis protein PqqB [Ahrensia sp.]
MTTSLRALSLRALVLGAAAGGGLPQWNCGCDNCNAARAPAGDIKPQTQSSLAVSANGDQWAILNTSPDIRQQLSAHQVLYPKKVRHTPISSVLLTNGDIDHIAGLLILREKQPFTVFATETILDVISANPIFNALDRILVTFTSVQLDQSFELVSGVQATLFAVPGKVPLFMEGETVDTQLEGEQTVGVRLAGAGKTMFYIPGCAAITTRLADMLTGADCVFFDGTVYENDEMQATGTGTKTGARMGHMAMNGEHGSMAAFVPLNVERKIYVHINNTNPVWNPASAEHATIRSAGWEIAQDGLEVTL